MFIDQSLPGYFRVQGYRSKQAQSRNQRRADHQYRQNDAQHSDPKLFPILLFLCRHFFSSFPSVPQCCICLRLLRFIGINCAGQLVRAGGITPALYSPQRFLNFVRIAANDHFGEALGVSLAAIMKCAGSDHAVFDFQIDLCGAGAPGLIMKHRSLLPSNALPDADLPLTTADYLILPRIIAYLTGALQESRWAANTNHQAKCTSMQN